MEFDAHVHPCMSITRCAVVDRLTEAWCGLSFPGRGSFDSVFQEGLPRTLGSCPTRFRRA